MHSIISNFTYPSTDVFNKGRTCWSPAPEAKDDLAKAMFYSGIAKAKNALASGVRCTGWLGDVLLKDFFLAKL
jgi:hypothetical protein